MRDSYLEDYQPVSHDPDYDDDLYSDDDDLDGFEDDWDDDPWPPYYEPYWWSDE